MGAENDIQDLGQERSRSLGKVFQGPVRDNVRARRLADLQTLDCIVNLVGVG